MGKKGVKNYIKIAINTNTIMQGFHIPVGSVSGRMGDTYYVYIPSQDNKPISVYDAINKKHIKTIGLWLSKMSWGDNAIIDERYKERQMRWNTCKISFHTEIGAAIKQFIKDNKVAVIKNIIWNDPRYLEIKKYDTTGITPRERRTGAFIVKTRPKCESIEWEEIWTGECLHGMRCTWNEAMDNPVAQTPFEGVTDTPEATMVNGMKVEQHKIRPEKNGSSKIKNYNGRYSKKSASISDAGKVTIIQTTTVRTYNNSEMPRTIKSKKRI